MRRLALLALPLLAACAATPPTGGTPTAAPSPAMSPSGGPPPPGSGFALGATGVPQVLLTPETSPGIVGLWEGPFHRIDMTTGVVAREPGGTARLIVEGTDDRLVTGRADWRFADGRADETRWTAALTRSGHLRIMNSRSYIHQTAAFRYMDLDLLLSDGRYYRHRMVFRGG